MENSENGFQNLKHTFDLDLDNAPNVDIFTSKLQNAYF